MILPYVLVLDFIQRLLDQNASNQAHSKRALDLCCGPGHFTRMLAGNLHFGEVIGVDLSEPMLMKASENAQREKLSDRLKYIKSDVSSLESIDSKSVDVVSFMDGAHHLSSPQDVTKVLKEADRVTRSDGIIVLLDPVRPSTESTASLYHRIAGQSYLRMGLSFFNKDFRDSLFASWSPEELFQAIPRDTKRKWVQLVPFGFPAFQIVIGLPEGRDGIFVSKGLSQSTLQGLIPKEWKADWNMLRFSFRFAKRKVLDQIP
jgi:ubiquinone/menaquinone biosynthesis C-methylase UbiE